MVGVRLLADENFNGRILRALKRQLLALDIVRAQECLPEGTPDPVVLAWAANEGRVVLSHDISTLVGYAAERIRRSEPMPGLIVMPALAPIGEVLADLELALGTSEPHHFQDQVLFLPLK